MNESVDARPMRATSGPTIRQADAHHDASFSSHPKAGGYGSCLVGCILQTSSPSNTCMGCNELLHVWQAQRGGRNDRASRRVPASAGRPLGLYVWRVQLWFQLFLGSFEPPSQPAIRNMHTPRLTMRIGQVGDLERALGNKVSPHQG